MKIIALAAILVSLSASSYAFELQALKAADIAEEPAFPAASAPAVPAQKQRQNLWMSVYGNTSMKQAQASDYSAGIDVRVSKSLDTMFSADVRVGTNSEWLNLSKFGGSFRLSGSGISLSMSEWGGNYSVSGTVTGEDNRTQYINLTLYKGFDIYSFNASGAGLSMNISGNSIGGSYDDDEYSKKAVAGIVALALAAQVDRMPA